MIIAPDKPATAYIKNQHKIIKSHKKLVDKAEKMLSKGIEVTDIKHFDNQDWYTVLSNAKNLKAVLRQKKKPSKFDTHSKQFGAIERTYYIHYSDVLGNTLGVALAYGNFRFHLKEDLTDLYNAVIKPGRWCKEYNANKQEGSWAIVRYRPSGSTMFPVKDPTNKELFELIKPYLLL